MTIETLDAPADNTTESPVDVPFDFNDGDAIRDAFPGIDEYQDFLLEDVGFVKWFRGTKEEKNGRIVTTGYGFIESRETDIYFRLPACQKYEFDPATNARKLVRQYRRINPGQAVTFNSKRLEQGLRTDLFAFWEPEEFRKVRDQETNCGPYPHRLVRITKRIDVKTNRTIGIDEEVIWEGDDLNEFRVACPRINPEFKVYKTIPEIVDGVKITVVQRVEYKDLLDGANHKPNVVCLDPR